jgi:hypothetical protein
VFYDAKSSSMDRQALTAVNGRLRCQRLAGALLGLLLSGLAGCYSFEDYVYPTPDVPILAETVRLGPEGIALGYDPAFDPLPVVGASIDARSVRALVATRHGWHAIAADAVPADAQVVGLATVPVLTAEGVVPEEREVVQVARIELGEAVLEGLHLMVEPLPEGVELLLTPAAFQDAVVTFDGPGRELRVRPGQLPKPKEARRDTVRMSLGLLMGPSAVKAPRFWASIEVVAASELDGPLLVGTSTCTTIETHRGPELLPLGSGALDPIVVGEREVRMDRVFGRDRERAVALELDGLGSGWLVLGAGFLANHVLELDPARRLARLD